MSCRTLLCDAVVVDRYTFICRGTGIEVTSRSLALDIFINRVFFYVRTMLHKLLLKPAEKREYKFTHRNYGTAAKDKRSDYLNVRDH